MNSPGLGDTARLFFAVIPDEATRERIARAAGALVLEPARLVPRSNYHSTLAFVGEIPAASIPALREVGAAQAAAAFSMRLDTFDFWPKPAVVVARASTVPASLEALWQRLHQDLAAHGWALNPKRLRPHVTLAKQVTRSPAFPAVSVVWEARDFSLMSSDTRGPQPVYTVLDTWPLLYDRGPA
jgi:2'-5' RNA ligase